MSSLGEDASDTDELKTMRVNDLDIKTAVDDLENSEDEDLEDENKFNHRKGKHRNGEQIMAQNKEDEEPKEESADAAKDKGDKEKKGKKSKEDKEESKDKKEDAKEAEGAEGESDGNSTSKNGSDGNSSDDGNSTLGMNKYGRYERAPGREEGDYGFDEPEDVESHPRYRKEMERVLGKTKEMKKR